MRPDNMLKTIEKALLLQEIDFLRFASADHLMQLAEAGREEIFKKGDTITRAGEPSLNFYILLLGRASCEGTLLEKSAVNLCSCLASAGQESSYVCMEDCTVLTLPTADLMDLLAGEPELSLALLKYFASKQLK